MANKYVASSDEATKIATTTGFQIIHQLFGVLLGEHIGQLFTITWTFMMSYDFIKPKTFPTWFGFMGIGTSIIYLFAQAELISTVIPGFPVWGMAGFIGSTLWLIWLIILGIFFIRQDVA